MRLMNVYYECPVDDCDWTLEPVSLRPEPFMEAAASVDEAVRGILTAEASALEDLLRGHMAMHGVEDFLKTIQRQRHSYNELERLALALLQKAGGDVTVTEAERESMDLAGWAITTEEHPGTYDVRIRSVRRDPKAR